MRELEIFRSIHWRNALSVAKDQFASALLSSGFLWRQVDRHLDGKVLVLTYHRVLPESRRDSFSAPGIIVTPETFDRHMSWIRSHFHPLTPAEFGQVLAGAKTPPRRSCLITFDDGWYDNLVHALPILERHRVPALLFAATGFIGTSRCFWQEQLARLLYVTWQNGVRGDQLLNTALVQLPAGISNADARSRVREAVSRLKREPTGRVQQLLLEFEGRLREIGVDPPKGFGEDRFLTWRELGELAASPMITIGSHAVSHTPLPRLPSKDISAELVQSRAMLQSRLDCGVDWFAYPNGDHDAASIDAVRASGYRGAFTTISGPVVLGQCHFSLPRVNVHEGSTRTLGRFLGRASGLL